MELNGISISINFFDLSGNDDYKQIREEFYADTQGVIMVFDVDNRDSFTSLVHWEKEMKRNGVDRSKMVICGNKVDGKGREVTTQEAQKWAKGCKYYETSASTGKNVNEAFECLFEMVLNQYHEYKAKFNIH